MSLRIAINQWELSFLCYPGSSTEPGAETWLKAWRCFGGGKPVQVTAKMCGHLEAL